MKRTQLKELIKSTFLKEDEDKVDMEYLLSQFENNSLEEAEEEEEESEAEEEEGGDLSAEDLDDLEGLEGKEEPPAMDDGEDLEISDDAKQIQDALQTALDGAREIGDKKLASQIGNIYTFFTRQHIVKTGQDINEGFERFAKLSGLE